MGRVEPPRPRGVPGASGGNEGEVPEPPTDRALWPTFMRRTIEADRLRRADQTPES
mgnify:CR=1 FL=1